MSLFGKVSYSEWQMRGLAGASVTQKSSALLNMTSVRVIGCGHISWDQVDWLFSFVNLYNWWKLGALGEICERHGIKPLSVEKGIISFPSILPEKQSMCCSLHYNAVFYFLVSSILGTSAWHDFGIQNYVLKTSLLKLIVLHWAL